MSNEKEINEKKLNAMKYKILKAEQENLKTREKNTDQMVELIRRIITDESKKNYWSSNTKKEKANGISACLV